MSNYQNSTFYIKAILVAATNIGRYIEQIIIEENIGGGTKKFLTDTRKKAESISRDIMLKTTPELAEIIRKEIADNWETLAHENIRFMALSLDDDKLRNLEQYTEDLMNDTYRPADYSDLNDLGKLLNDTIGIPNYEEKLKILQQNGFDIVRKNT